MKTSLDREIEDLLTALRLQPRKAWADEVGVPQVAGRCAGSYGCAVPPDQPERAVPVESTNPVDSFFRELQELLRAGVSVEHAFIALGRKHGKNEDLAIPLLSVIHVLRNPDSTKEAFAKAIVVLASFGSSKALPLEVMNALEHGRLDAI